MSTPEVARSLGISPESSMVSGYNGTHYTLEQMEARWSWRVLHDGMQRMHLTMYFSHPATRLDGYDADGYPILTTPMGVGSAGRQSGPAAVANFWSRWSRTYIAGRPTRMTPEGRAWLKPGYAQIAYPGTSNHEDDTFQNSAMAVDNVGWQDGWMADNVARFGLKTFWNVGSEPWHTQLAGYGNSKSALQHDLGRYGFPEFDLPAIPFAKQPAPVTPPTTPPELNDPEEDEMAYLQLPPPERAGHPWFFIQGGSARLATGHDDVADMDKVVDTHTDRVKRYDLLHESVVGRKPT